MTVQATKKEPICQWFALSLAQDNVCNESSGLQPCPWHGWLHAHAQPQNHGRPLSLQEPHVSHLNSTVKCPSSSPELAPFQWPCLASWHCRCLDGLPVVVTCLFGDLHSQSPNSPIVLLLDIGPAHCPCDAYVPGSADPHVQRLFSILAMGLWSRQLCTQCPCESHNTLPGTSCTRSSMWCWHTEAL